ncbi:hypothetical protein, partial [Paenibacillus durus]|uniref:hypothetical protein n=1 Tax=Paenibacillus durus TaxID=44251 RepID=UPI00138AED6A
RRPGSQHRGNLHPDSLGPGSLRRMRLRMRLRMQRRQAMLQEELRGTYRVLWQQRKKQRT